MFDTKNKRSNSETVDYHVSFVGAGAAPVVVQADTGQGMTVTRNGVGLVTIAFVDDPGIYEGFQASFSAAAPAGVRGYTCEASRYAPATRSLQLNIVSAAQALVDLAAAQYLDVTVTFKRSGKGV